MILVRPAAQEIDSELKQLKRHRAGSPEALKQSEPIAFRRLCGTEHRRDAAHAARGFPVFERFCELEPPALFAIKFKRTVLSARKETI